MWSRRGRCDCYSMGAVNTELTVSACVCHCVKANGNARAAPPNHVNFCARRDNTTPPAVYYRLNVRDIQTAVTTNQGRFSLISCESN